MVILELIGGPSFKQRSLAKFIIKNKNTMSFNIYVKRQDNGALLTIGGMTPATKIKDLKAAIAAQMGLIISCDFPFGYHLMFQATRVDEHDEQTLGDFDLVADSQLIAQPADLTNFVHSVKLGVDPSRTKISTDCDNSQMLSLIHI